ncbi:hypothetical protein SprV_1002845700 [Sparganum proliferum]
MRPSHPPATSLVSSLLGLVLTPGSGGGGVESLVLEAKQRLRQEQAAKGQAAFTKTVHNGFATAIDYPGIGASSRPLPVPPKSSHDAAGSEKWRQTGSTSRPFVLPPSQLPVDVVKTESAEFRVNQGPSGGSPTAAVSDRVQATAIDAVGDDGRLESTEGQTKRGTTGAVERCRRRKCKRKRSPEVCSLPLREKPQAGVY